MNIEEEKIKIYLIFHVKALIEYTEWVECI